MKETVNNKRGVFQGKAKAYVKMEENKGGKGRKPGRLGQKGPVLMEGGDLENGGIAGKGRKWWGRGQVYH